MFAKGAYKVLGQFAALVNVAADLADITLFILAQRLGLRLYMVKVISICKRRSVG